MFKDILSQTMSGVTPGTDDPSGGVNAKQIGLGVSIGSIDTLHTPGSAMTTNNPTDLRIDGDGFFMVKLSEDQEVPFLTRAGDFHVDVARNLVTSDGMLVLDSAGDPIQLDEEVTAFTIAQNGAIIQKMSDGTTEEGPFRRWRKFRSGRPGKNRRQYVSRDPECSS
ncbi:Distal rod protein [Actinobacillus pleuropneumoniae]|nr:Distal rod protein [Actinobacillus pleuropneumoniae]